MHMSFTARLMHKVLPVTFYLPEEVAIVRSLARAGHVRAHVEDSDGSGTATVLAMTPLGAKVASCYSHGASSRLATTFWAFRVQESEPQSPKPACRRAP
jgi:hypothetical protein